MFSSLSSNRGLDGILVRATQPFPLGEKLLVSRETDSSLSVDIPALPRAEGGTIQHDPLPQRGTLASLLDQLSAIPAATTEHELYDPTLESTLQQLRGTLANDGTPVTHEEIHLWCCLTLTLQTAALWKNARPALKQWVPHQLQTYLVPREEMDRQIRPLLDELKYLREKVARGSRKRTRPHGGLHVDCPPDTPTKSHPGHPTGAESLVTPRASYTRPDVGPMPSIGALDSVGVPAPFHCESRDMRRDPRAQQRRHNRGGWEKGAMQRLAASSASLTRTSIGGNSQGGPGSLVSRCADSLLLSSDLPRKRKRV